MDLTQEQKSEQTLLDRLYARFEHFYDLDPNLTLSHIMGLLYIKQHQDRLEGVTNSDLTEKLVLSPSGATRIIYYWEDIHGFLETKIDQKDRRRRLLRLTANGEEFIALYIRKTHGNV